MTARTVRARRPRLTTLLGWTLLAVAAGAGVLVALHGFGVVDIPLLRRETPAVAEVRGPSAPVVPAGKVAVPISARPIEAYRLVTRDDLWDRATQGPAVFYMSPERIQADQICANLGDVLHRVLRHDKPSGYVFRESDFFPRGTRPGVTAGIPPGKRALRLDAQEFPGLRDLEAGDRFDIVAAIAVDRSARSPMPRSLDGPLASRLEIDAALQRSFRRAEVRLVAEDAVVVVPVTSRERPGSARGAAGAGSRSYEDVVVALTPAEIVAFQEALAVEATVACTPRSGRASTGGGQPADPVEAPEGADRPPLFGGREPDVHLVELVTGAKRGVDVVPPSAPPLPQTGAAESR